MEMIETEKGSESIATTAAPGNVSTGDRKSVSAVPPQEYRVTFEGILHITAARDFDDATQQAIAILTRLGAVAVNPRTVYRYPESRTPIIDADAMNSEILHGERRVITRRACFGNRGPLDPICQGCSDQIACNHRAEELAGLDGDQ